MLSADEIPGTIIVGSSFISNDYVATGSSNFSVQLGDGNAITDTTAGSSQPIGYTWQLHQGGNLVHSSQGNSNFH